MVFHLGKKDKSVNQLNFENLQYHFKEAQYTHPWGQKGEVYYYILIPLRALSFIIKNRLASDHKYGISTISRLTFLCLRIRSHI